MLIAAAFTPTVARHTRRAAATADSRLYSKATSAASVSACKAMTSEGGAMFEMRSPGMPTSERGHGPNATNAALVAQHRPAIVAARAALGRLVGENTHKPVCPARAHTSTKLASLNAAGAPTRLLRSTTPAPMSQPKQANTGCPENRTSNGVNAGHQQICPEKPQELRGDSKQRQRHVVVPKQENRRDHDPEGDVD